VPLGFRVCVLLCVCFCVLLVGGWVGVSVRLMTRMNALTPRLPHCSLWWSLCRYARGARAEASAWSIEAGGFASEIQSLTATVVSATLREHNTPTTAPATIDLHGLYVAEAVSVMERYLDLHRELAAR
jgi:hypothetical protein